MKKTPATPDDAAVIAAAQWVADREPMHDIIPQLKMRFGLSARQSAEACTLAQKYRTLRRAFA